MECQFDVDETARDLQSVHVSPDNVDGRWHHQYEFVKQGVQETSLYPSGMYVSGGTPQNSNTRLSTTLTKLPLKEYSKVCMILNIKRDLKFDDFRMLAEKVGFNRDEIRYIEQCANPTDTIIQTWSSKSEATVGNLIELLKGEDLERMDVVKVLEDWVNNTSD